MMKTRHFFAVLSGLAALVSPLSVADTVAGTPDATVHYESNTVGAAIAALPLLNEVSPSTSAQYYVYLCSAGWCAPCNREMPHIVEAYKDMKASGKVELLLLDYDYTEDEANAFIEKYGMMFPATMSVHSASLPGFTGPRGIPYAIIVDGEGNVVAKGYGAILRDWKTLIAAYESEKGQVVSFPESLTLTLAPQRTLAAAEKASEAVALEDEVDSGNVVAKALATLDWFNGKPNQTAEYYIYLQSASWCGPCRQEMPDIAKEYKAMKRAHVELVLISGDRSESDAQNFLKSNKAKFPGTMQADQARCTLPGAASLPSYYPAAVIVRADGTVVTAGHGSLVGDWRKFIGKSARSKRHAKN